MKLEADSRKRGQSIMANYETILVDRKNDVVTVTLNRPQQKKRDEPEASL